VLVWVEDDGKELSVSTSVQEMNVPVDGVKRQTLSLVFGFAVLTLTSVVLVLLPTSPLMEQATTGCVVEQEDIRKVKLLSSMVIPRVPKLQLMITMLMDYQSHMTVPSTYLDLCCWYI